MTTPEKANLCDGEGSWHTHGVERLGIPGAMMTDGPHGLRKMVMKDGKWSTNAATCMPTASALAASWNRAVAAHAANTIAKDAIAEGVAVVLGPGVNMKRSPLCGRNFEYFSEDPYFAGSFAAAYISAMQQNGVGSCIKHFAVNNQETRRFTVSANVAARPLHETYLRAFEIAIQAAKP
ncbi:MAG: glycoside hydrolase family 3 protein, partial [Clostridiales bacterium]|nr:glycoside hydrolase family 3 protein [Clostridiales bacterium]